MADPEYPARLRTIKDAPPVIYVRGSKRAITQMGCAVVGTRHASETGRRIAERIAGILARRNLSTISGLALGIDTAAHVGALDAGGVTIAILAHGLDTVAPTSNRGLAQRILDSGGALISEHEPKVPPRPAEFVRRNRIQSGMALCSIIVESGAVGGSMHQARFTKQQGRTVFAVQPELNGKNQQDFNAEGGELLVRDLGAIPLRHSDELGSYLDTLLPQQPEDPSAGAQLKFSL